MAKAGESHDCNCSPDCDAQTRRIFAPGHDARLVSRLVKGKLTPARAAAAVKQAGGSPGLQAKARAAVEKARAK